MAGFHRKTAEQLVLNNFHNKIKVLNPLLDIAVLNPYNMSQDLLIAILISYLLVSVLSP